MNKSKFLKKSLAMVLAMLMVVAMIPLGASAATPGVVSVTVAGKAATLSGTTYTVTGLSSATANNAANTPVVVVINDQDGGLVTSNGQSCTVGNSQWTIIPTADQYAKTAELNFTVWNQSTRESTTYKVDFSFAPASTDASIASINFTNKNTQYGSTSVSGKAYTITAAYAAINPASDTLTVKLGSEAATLSVSGATASQVKPGEYTITGYTVGTAFTMTVVPQVGATSVYTAKVVAPGFFPTFAAAGERKAAKIENVTTTSADVTVYLPYGYEKKTVSSVDYYEVPVTFSVGYPSATVETAAVVAGGSTAKPLKSGDKVYVPVASAATGIALTYKYPTGADSTITLKVDIPAKDPVAAITGVKVGAYTGKVEGTNLVVELPATYMATATAVALQVKGSVGSKVELVGTSDAIASASGSLENLVASYDASAEAEKLVRVTSTQADDDGNYDEKVYTLKIVKVGVQEEAVINAMVLKDTEDNTYTASIDNNYNITFTLPYSLDVAADLNKWTLETGVSRGATVTYGADTLENSLALDTTAAGKLFPGTFPAKETDAAAAGATLTVTASNNSTNTYYVKVKTAAPEIGKSIEELSVTSANTKDTADDNNTWKGAVSGNTITVEVPYNSYISKNFATASKMFPIFKASKGATVYYVGKSAKDTDTLATIGTLTNWDDDGNGTAITVDGAYFDGVKADGTADAKVALTMVVASEGAEPLTNYNSAWWTANSGKYTEYKLVVKCKTPSEICGVPTVTMFDNVTGEKVNGVVSGNSITFGNIPYHFIADSNAAGGVYIDYKVNNGEWVGTSKGTWIDPITYKDGKVDTTVPGGWKVTLGARGADGTVTITGFSSLYIESEKGNKGTVTVPSQTYSTVSCTAAPAETGAVLSSVTINNVVGKPDSNNKITIALPVGTEITSLVPSFVTSKYATVKLGNAGGATIVSGETALNFTADQTVTVVSEAGTAYTKTYTIHVEASQSFDDVHPSDWFYSVVMRAFDLGIVKGVSTTKFNPNGNVTRGQFALFIARADGYNQNAYMTESKFKDVPAGTETSAAIDYCQKMGYLGGYGDGTFKPNKNITRAEMAKIVANALGLPETTGEGFADVKGNWAEGYIYAVKNAGIIDGKSATKFDPNGLTKRCEAAKVVMGVYDAK